MFCVDTSEIDIRSQALLWNNPYLEVIFFFLEFTLAEFTTLSGVEVIFIIITVLITCTATMLLFLICANTEKQSLSQIIYNPLKR